MEKELLKKFNFSFNKGYGQNFIFDHNLLSAIVADAGIEGKDVLEIGPGAGGLTYEIAKVANKVVAYEIDEKLKPILSENLQNFNNVELRFCDVMKQDIKDIENSFVGSYSLVANLPYYITTPIIFKFIENSNKVDKLVIMVQYEVAKRLIAKPNTADYGAITVALGVIGDVQITRKVGRHNFVPAPNVDSAIVTIDINRNKFDIKDTATLSKLIKSAFAMRRKTLANNLKKDFGLNAEQIADLFAKCDLDISIRGEALDFEQFVALANVIFIKFN